MTFTYETVIPFDIEVNYPIIDWCHYKANDAEYDWEAASGLTGDAWLVMPKVAPNVMEIFAFDAGSSVGVFISELIVTDCAPLLQTFNSDGANAYGIATVDVDLPI